jgi:hypothetical protein
VTLARLGAECVTMTDIVTEVLSTLRSTMHLNWHAVAAPPPVGRPNLEAHGNSGDMGSDELGFSDAQSNSDESELCREGEGSHVHNRSAPPRAWDAGNMRIRFMDWKAEWDALAETTPECSAFSGAVHPNSEDDSKSPLDLVSLPTAANPAHTAHSTSTGSAHPVACLSTGNAPVIGAASTSAPTAARARDSTFDEPSPAADLPPQVPAGEQFPVIVGCEVVYEMPHAKWLPAALNRRLECGGKALVIGAVRDSQVLLQGMHLSADGIVNWGRGNASGAGAIAERLRLVTQVVHISMSTCEESAEPRWALEDRTS